MQPFNALVAAASGLGPELSIAIPVTAAFVGALAGGLARLWLDSRERRAEFRATVWVIGHDLGQLREHLKSRPITGLGLAGDPNPEGDAWTALERWTPADLRVIARGLGSDPATWGKVRGVKTLASDYRPMLVKRAQRGRAASPDPDLTTRTFLLDEQLTKTIEGALKDLDPYLKRAHRRYRWHVWRTVRSALDPRPRQYD